MLLRFELRSALSRFPLATGHYGSDPTTPQRDIPTSGLVMIRPTTLSRPLRRGEERYAQRTEEAMDGGRYGLLAAKD